MAVQCGLILLPSRGGLVSSLSGSYYKNGINTNLAEIYGDREYATVAEVIAFFT